MADEKQTDETPEPRMDKVEEAKWRIANGYYNLDFVLEEAVEQILKRALDPPTH